MGEFWNFGYVDPSLAVGLTSQRPQQWPGGINAWTIATVYARMEQRRARLEQLANYDAATAVDPQTQEEWEAAVIAHITGIEATAFEYLSIFAELSPLMRESIAGIADSQMRTWIETNVPYYSGNYQKQMKNSLQVIPSPQGVDVQWNTGNTLNAKGENYVTSEWAEENRPQNKAAFMQSLVAFPLILESVVTQLEAML